MIRCRVQTYLRRDASGAQSGDGEVYAAPYRWGCTVVAYRGDELARRGIPPIIVRGKGG